MYFYYICCDFPDLHKTTTTVAPTTTSPYSGHKFSLAGCFLLVDNDGYLPKFVKWDKLRGHNSPDACARDCQGLDASSGKKARSFKYEAFGIIFMDFFQFRI